MGTAKQTKQILMEVPLRSRSLNRLPIPRRQRLGIMPSLQSDFPYILDECQPVTDERRPAGVLLPGKSRPLHSSLPQASQIRRAYSGGPLALEWARGSRMPASLSQMGAHRGCKVLVGNHVKSMVRPGRLMCRQSNVRFR
jgi:hypothetical protein